MLFNSYEFIFAFLPATIVIFFLCGKLSRNLALSWIVIASLLFYAWWRPENILIIGASLATNYVFAQVLIRLRNNNNAATLAQIILAIGIALNLIFLGYFKYINFFQTVMNDLAGTDFVLKQIILPLGISFFTFQQIAFLIDIHGQRIKTFTWRTFSLFVLFFPQLIAGPIVHYNEMMPQFLANNCKPKAENLSVGLTLFFFGLFKKTVLADGIAPHVSAVYALAGNGGDVTLFPAWLAAMGFTLQIYFDFSGYSDMAIGLGRCFGIHLPVNFDSPLKTRNIIDFWSRWHITLTRFLTAYVYNPLALWITRRRLRKGLPGFTGKNPNGGAFIQILAIPTIFTMSLSGLWHGAGYLFLLWGLLHGMYLTINHVWRLVATKYWPDRKSYARVMNPLGLLITFVAVVFGMVLFRSPDLITATAIMSGMTGINGIGLPASVLESTGLTATLAPVITPTYPGSLTQFVTENLWLLMLTGIALLLPNSLEIMHKFKPALGFKITEERQSRLIQIFAWKPGFAWMITAALIAAIGVLRISSDSEFLYWQF
ncbi:MAG: MBOAT family protein [Gammaproteobacteria bacterium]|nr:MBOAT family protein [Gammaproteobacteria bacterium]